MVGCEMYIYEDSLWRLTDDGQNIKITENDIEFINFILEKIRELYPEAYNTLEKEYQNSRQNIRYYQYLMVRRFCKCNFGSLDAKRKDITSREDFNFERVQCPLRGECKCEGVICSPKLNTKLSEAELRVMKLLYYGSTTDEIAQELYISPNTVKVHCKNVYAKLKLRSKSDFVRYANDNKLFE